MKVVVGADRHDASTTSTSSRRLAAGKLAGIETRKLNRGDCVCSNEMTFYPPLCEVKNAVPAFTTDGHYNGPGLGTHWSNPNTRSAFIASFSYRADADGVAVR